MLFQVRTVVSFGNYWEAPGLLVELFPAGVMVTQMGSACEKFTKLNTSRLMHFSKFYQIKPWSSYL